uniref:Uncharacterized protein n=1 Tax=Glossina pallidipes TaxID=7398 RepID=A0A1A9ZXZ9_GLOPL
MFSGFASFKKKKKRLEKQVQQIDGTLSTIEMQREALECANTNTAVLRTMKNGTGALQEPQFLTSLPDKPTGQEN